MASSCKEGSKLSSFVKSEECDDQLASVTLWRKTDTLSALLSIQRKELCKGWCILNTNIATYLPYLQAFRFLR